MHNAEIKVNANIVKTIVAAGVVTPESCDGGQDLAILHNYSGCLNNYKGCFGSDTTMLYLYNIIA